MPGSRSQCQRSRAVEAGAILRLDGLVTHPILECHRVPLGGLFGPPRGVERHLGSQRVDLLLQLGRQLARCAVRHLQSRPAVIDDQATLQKSFECLDAQLLAKIENRSLSRTNPLSASLDNPALADVMVDGAAADSITR